MIPFIKEFANRFDEDRVFDLSAQCAYYFLFSLFPFLLFSITLLGFLPLSSNDLIKLIAEHAPGTTNELIEKNIRSILDVKRSGLLSFGILITLWSSSSGMDSMVKAINRAYRIREERSYIRSKLLSISLTFGMILAIFSALVLTVFGERIEYYLHTYLHLPETSIFISNTFRWIVNLAILTLMFLGLYYIAPNTCLRCKDVIPGAIFAALGWLFASLIFSYYVNHFGNFTETYGSLGGVIIMMIWFYLTALILIVGGVLNSVIPTMRRR
ncbi:MAG TPA: YihY/virulence factor BrkB family protein [Bacillota bacterium]|nr:YihY/virulence factor BrkB family protein [Bacillota bacterium]